MSDVVNIGVALVELEHAERAAVRAQGVLQKLVNAGSATQADKDAFGIIAAQLLAIESELYAKLVAAINTLPDVVAQPIVAQLPVPSLLPVPVAVAAGVAGLGNPAIPPILVWAAVVLAVILTVIVAVAVVWTIQVSIETISQIILTYRAADTYGNALQRRVECISACQRNGSTLEACTASCNAAVVLPAPPTPPAPPVASNPNAPWYVGGAVLGGLGALGLGLWFLERRAR